MRTRLSAWICALALAALPASLVGADQQVVTTALGQDGRLVSLLQGSYGELVPAGSEAGPDVPVLALRWTSPEGGQHVEAVPATLDLDREDTAELVVVPESGVTFVFWQSWTTLIQSRFRVTSFDGETWTDPIEVTSAAFAWRTSPAFGASGGDFLYVADGEAGTERVQRTILHILWAEEADGGIWLTKYAPLLLENGHYVGSHPIIVLNDLLDALGGDRVSDLRIAPVLRNGRDRDAMIAAFFDQRTGRIASVELRFADDELSLLGDAVADEIERWGSERSADLRSAVRARLLSYVDHVKPEILHTLAGELDGHLRDHLGDDAADLASIRDGARVHLIDIGFRVTDGRMRRATAEARVHLIDIGARRSPRRHDARVSVASMRPIDGDLPAAPEILVSSDGGGTILTWQEGNRLRYREGVGTGWKPPQEIRLTEKLDREGAMTILQRRVDQ